ncbi:DnaJ-domain-containing protein [Mycena floridula]|nr:DnaJ-domain-containing protein [Mycena floridula]
MPQIPDYYRLLDIPQTASHDEIKQAYKKASLRTHPDKLKNATEAERKVATEKFQAVAEAYFVLSDPVRRREYDQGSGAGNNRPDADNVFADVFDELLRPEVVRHGPPLWTYLGAACGVGLGYIVGNVPGDMLGAYAGNMLGAVRDAKGKSIAAIFQELSPAQKEEVVHALVMKVFGSAL